VRLAGAEADLFEFLQAARIPLVTARNANDIVDSGHELYIGRPGTFAQRGANFAVQTCDVYLAIGTRLSLAQTGYNAKDYARNAKIIMVDVDRAELDKGTVNVHLKVQADAKMFLQALNRERTSWPDWSAWLERCKAWQVKYQPVSAAQRTQAKYVNSYALVGELSAQLGPDDVVVTDMGFAFQNTHQAFRVKQGQRVFTNCGLAPMGWGLPAAIGAAVGSGRRTVCIAGDGGFMFNAQELATLAHHRLPVKIFLLNNGGYLTMRQSQAHAFESYMGSDEGSGLSFPDFGQLTAAHRVVHRRVARSAEVRGVVEAVLSAAGPVLCEVMMDQDQSQIPKSVNRRDENGNIKQTAIEDAWPYLPREEIEENLRV
jgi:acetolactate synthase-1/2/3 large subunit